MGVDSRPGRADILSIPMSEVSKSDAERFAQVSGADLEQVDGTSYLRYPDPDETVLSLSHAKPRPEVNEPVAHLSNALGLSVSLDPHQLVLGRGRAAIVDYVGGDRRSLTLEMITFGSDGIKVQVRDVYFDPSRPPSDFDRAVIQAAQTVYARRKWPRS